MENIIDYARVVGGVIAMYMYTQDYIYCKSGNLWLDNFRMKPKPRNENCLHNVLIDIKWAPTTKINLKFPDLR